MKNTMIYGVLIGIISGVMAATTVTVYESDGQTEFEGQNIRVGTELKLIVTSDANDFWSGGLFMGGNDRTLAVLSGSGKDPNSRDLSDCHLENAGPEALVTEWEDSLIEGFDLFSDSNGVPGEWFMIDYTALAPGDPNVGFYEYSISWVDPNSFITIHQVPTSDFNTDGIVNLLDYLLLASCWQEDNCTDPNGCQKADLDSDGTVDVNDLLMFTEDWLWGLPEPNEPVVPQPDPNEPLVPQPDPNLFYRIIDANGLDEITLHVGQTVILYVDIITLDVNEVWAFTTEVNISDPNLGTIDNTAYDPNDPPGTGTARILASPNRWTMFDYWCTGYEQEEGIYLSGCSSGGGFEDGSLARFEFTCQGVGDVELNLINWDTTSTTGSQLYPTLEGMVIHQNDPNAQSMMSSSMSTSLMRISEEPSVSEDTFFGDEPSLNPEQMARWLEEIWQQDDGVQDIIRQEDWLKFVDSVRQGN